MCACINRFGTEKKMSCFFWGMSLRQQYLNELKKIFYKLSSWDFFFKTSTITIYENAKDLKFRCPSEKNKLL